MIMMAVMPPLGIASLAIKVQKSRSKKLPTWRVTIKPVNKAYRVRTNAVDALNATIPYFNKDQLSNIFIVRHIILAAMGTVKFFKA